LFASSLILPEVDYSGLVFKVNFQPGWARFILQNTFPRLADPNRQPNT
jgi:hypothetical protein